MNSICFITDTRGFGGTEIHTLNLMRILATKGYGIELVCCTHEMYEDRIDAKDKESIKVFRVDVGVDQEGGAARKKWKEALSKIKSEILIFPKGWNYMGSDEFLKQCRKNFEKIFVIEHLEADPMPEKSRGEYLGGLIRGPGFWWHREKYRRKARSFYADHIIAVSDVVRESLIKHVDYPPEKISSVQNGVYWKDFRRNTDLGSEFRREYDISEGTFVFGMITRLKPVKGIDIALKAFARLLETAHLRDSRLVISGEGEEGEEYRELAGKLGIEKYVLFTGFVSDPLKALSAFDVILFPSRKEGLPLSLLEGMAAGCFPIVTRISGMPEVVNTPQVGIVVEPESVTELHHAMDTVLEMSDSELSSKRKCAVERIRESFDAEKSFGKIVDIFGL